MGKLATTTTTVYFVNLSFTAVYSHQEGYSPMMMATFSNSIKRTLVSCLKTGQCSDTYSLTQRAKLRNQMQDVTPRVLIAIYSHGTE